MNSIICGRPECTEGRNDNGIDRRLTVKRNCYSPVYAKGRAVVILYLAQLVSVTKADRILIGDWAQAAQVAKGVTAVDVINDRPVEGFS